MLLDEAPVQETQGARDRFLQLRSFSTFGALDDESVYWLAEHCRPRFFPKGAVLQREGSSITHSNIVQRGSVRVVRKGTEVAVVRRGRGVGFLSVLGRDENGVFAEALEDTMTLEVPAEALLQAYEEDFNFLRNAIRNMASTLLEDRGNLPTRNGVQPEIEEGVLRDRPRTLVERMLILKDAGIFAGKNLDAIIDAARRQKEVRFEPDTVVWNIGDESLFNLRTEYGRFECTSPEGRSVIIGAKFVIGALDVFTGDPRRFSVRTLTPAVGLTLGRDVFMSVLENHRELAVDLAAILARNLLEKT